jgi:hypothetical protein
MAPGGFASIHFARSLSAQKIEKRVADLDAKTNTPTVKDTEFNIESQNKTTANIPVTNSVPVKTTTHDDQSAQPTVDDLERLQRLLRVASSDFTSTPTQESTLPSPSTSTSAMADPTLENGRPQERHASHREASSEDKVKIFVEAFNKLTPPERLEVLRIIRGQAKQRGMLRVEMLSREMWW